jgi:GT2 family glycosyltransferase
MSALPRVLLIVVNWNGRAYLEGCLSSLLALDYPDFSVTVVDNASTDGSPDFVRDRFPEVALLCSAQNLGYGGGANLALRTCLADVAVVLNTDISVPADWLTNLVAPLADDPAIGIAGSKMYYPGGQIIQHAGGYITAPQAWPGHYGLNDKDQGQHNAIRDVDYVIGAALAVKRTALKQIGLFDEGYFLYYEDVDLCRRARRAGYRVVYIPDAWLTHLESAITVKGSPAYLEWFYRGRWRFILKHYDPAQILSASIPAEQAWLTRCSPGERQAAAVAYRATINALPEILLARSRDGHGQAGPIDEDEQSLLADRLRGLLAMSLRMPEPPLRAEAPPEMNDEINNPASPLGLMRERQLLREQPFSSQVPIVGPLIARLRAAWNSVSTKWYVRPLLQQQNEFNQLAATEITTQAERLNVLAGEVARLNALAGEVGRLRDWWDVRAHDHDAWLIAQDREQAEFVRDLAELRLLVIQMNRLLLDLNEHAQRTDATNSAQAKDRVG